MIRILTILFFLIIQLELVAQNQYLDSLRLQLDNSSISVEEKFNSYSLLIEGLRVEQLYNQATTINQQMKALAQQENNYRELTKSYVYQGVILNNQEIYDKSATCIDSAKNAAAQTNDNIAKAYSLYLISYHERMLDNYQHAMKITLEALSLLEKKETDFNLEFKLYYTLYGIYTEWNDADNTMKYAKKLIETAQSTGNKNNLSNAYSAMAVVYTYRYQESTSQADLDAIFEYSEKAAILYQQFPGLVGSYTYAIASNNLASYLLEYSKELTPKIQQQIIMNINSSLAVSEKLTEGQIVQAGSLGMLSYLAIQASELDKAEGYLLKAHSILLAKNPVYYHLLSKITADLSELYEQKGDLKKALEYQRKVVEYNNQLFNQQEAAAAKKLEIQFHFDKKEQEVMLLTERVENQRMQKLLYAVLGIIGLLGAFFMFRSYHYRLRFSLEREKQLNHEKIQTEMQIKFEKEEQVRLRMEQELLTLQQEKLQNEVMANQLHLQHKNQVLMDLKLKISDDKSFNINQILKEEELLDGDFEKAKFQIQSLHPNFFKILNEKSVQKLTALDLKYCAYFYLGMDTKQIANLLHVEPKSVRMTKYRLKQKFGLEGDLDNFLKQII